MADSDSHSSIDVSSGSSDSEGEYEVEEAEGFQVPNFNFSGWNPDPPAGINFLGLLPMRSGYQLANEQHIHQGKLTISAQHRQQRRKNFSRCATFGKNVIAEKKLLLAVNNKDAATVQELLDGGVNVCVHDEKNRSALHFAAAKGDERIVSLLLKYGANPNQKDSIGNTPLHLAACTQHISVVTLLLRAGTDLQSLDNSGRSPLHLAKTKLRLISQNTMSSSDEIRKSVCQIVDMMREYLSCSGQFQEVDQLQALSQQLQSTSDSQQLLSINELLSNFTQLTLDKQEQERQPS